MAFAHSDENSVDLTQTHSQEGKIRSASIHFRDLLQKRDYRLQYEGVANIKEWGAVGDGETDDTVAVELAIKAVVENRSGGIVQVPPGTYRLSKRLSILTSRPFMLRGEAPDVSRIMWSGGTTEGMAITPKGDVQSMRNNGQVTVSGISLLCEAPEEAPCKSAALLINGDAQLEPNTTGPSPGKERLKSRCVSRIRVTSVAIRGNWKYGLVLRSLMLAEVEHLNISGAGWGKKNSSATGLLIDGVGSPTGHTLENLRIFNFATGILIKSTPDKGRIEGVKVHNCNIVAVVTGIKADSCLELSVVQNHINCAQAGVVAIDCDQCFFTANLIYQSRGQGHGIWLSGNTQTSTSHVICGNCIVGVQDSEDSLGVTLDGGISGAVVTNNIFNKLEHAVCRPRDSVGWFGHVCCEGNVCRSVKYEYDIPKAPQVAVRSLMDFAEQQKGNAKKEVLVGSAEHSKATAGCCGVF